MPTITAVQCDSCGQREALSDDERTRCAICVAYQSGSEDGRREAAVAALAFAAHAARLCGCNETQITAATHIDLADGGYEALDDAISLAHGMSA
jgi:hypothetical protein